MYKGLVAAKLGAWVSTLGLIGIVCLLYFFGGAIYVLYVIPVIIPMLLSLVFLRTLLPGKTPLATVIAERARGGMSESVRRYTRGVTVMWSVLLASLALWSALLPFVASPEVWSLFTGFLNYLIIAVVFMLEFAFRNWHLKDEEPVGFVPFMRTLRNANFRNL